MLDAEADELCWAQVVSEVGTITGKSRKAAA
jgi:hypothetical protein